MYVSSPENIAGRRILIVEDDAQLAAEMAAWVRRGEGEVASVVATPEAALAALDGWPHLDAVMVDVETANGLALPLVRRFEARGVVVIWIIGHDGWFFDPDEEASVYRLEGDPDNVLRVRWPPTHSRDG